eukprot:gene32723-43735_t
MSSLTAGLQTIHFSQSFQWLWFSGVSHWSALGAQGQTFGQLLFKIRARSCHAAPNLVALRTFIGLRVFTSRSLLPGTKVSGDCDGPARPAGAVIPKCRVPGSSELHSDPKFSLVAPLQISTAVDFAYYLVHPKAKGRLPQVKAFITWIEAEAIAHEDALRAIDNGAAPSAARLAQRKRMQIQIQSLDDALLGHPRATAVLQALCARRDGT